MVILDTSFSCIKYLLKTIVGFYFLQVIIITNQSSILLPIVFCNASGYFSLFYIVYLIFNLLTPLVSALSFTSRILMA